MPVDLYWTLDGDFAPGEDGDLRDTSFDSLRSLFQEIRTRVMSSFRDWKFHPSLGANLDTLLGKPNNRLTAEEGKTAIVAALTQGGFLPRNAIEVRYLPFGRHWLAYLVQVKVAVPETGQTRMLKVQLLYDTLESSIAVL